MISREVLMKVKKIEIKTRHLVNNLFGGKYQIYFKCQGMIFSEVREYQHGDEIRLIDWNVTAKNNFPYVKVFEEERELSVFLVVDASLSESFGSKLKLKSELGAEIASVLGLSALKNNDKVGLLIFTDIIETFLPPKKGTSHILRIISELIKKQPSNKGTDISNALNYILKVINRKSVIFLISDFIDKNFEKSLKILNKKHDVICIKLYDDFENNLKNLGLLKLHDSETNEEFWLDTSNEVARKQFQKLRNDNNLEFLEYCKKNNFDIIPISTSSDFVKPIVNYLNNRDKK